VFVYIKDFTEYLGAHPLDSHGVHPLAIEITDHDHQGRISDA